MYPHLDVEHEKLRERVRAWAEEKAAAAAVADDGVEAVAKMAKAIVPLLGGAGWLKHLAPRRFGGAGETISLRELCLLREELARVAPLFDTVLSVQALGMYPIALAASDEQKQNFLPPLASGEKIAAFALSEPNAGSDVASIQTRATKRNGDYRLTGIKSFISNAGIADIYIVFASTEPAAKGKGLSAFIVDARSPGLDVREKTRLIAPHPIGVLAFEDCVVPSAGLIGREGDGMKIALATLDALRPTVGGAAVGLARRALEEALDHSRTRRQFGSALADFQGIQFKVAEMATELEAASLLVYQAAWMHDRGVESKCSAAMAKLFATEAAQRIVDQALQIHGGMGVVTTSVVAQLYNAVRALRIYEGTSEIQKLVIARELLKK
ncbi:MAG TPA: acyl-CoA dehydrogenase family protein [Candidatus Binatia bacterium]|jgi:alkylation response protein AidB-like acyl-CoA dehydrogenase